MTGRAVVKTISLPSGSTATYWSARFDKENGEPGLMVAWAWGVDGDWIAATSPRQEFIRRDSLYKFYVSRLASPNEKAGQTEGLDPTKEFLTEFLPAMKPALAPKQ